MRSFFRRPLFWLSFTLISILGFIYAFAFFSKAFPIINITITMDKDQATNQARHLAKEFSWANDDAAHAVSFDSNTITKYFIELEGGGQDAFIKMIQEKLFMPYMWHVRLFKEYEPHEAHVYFTPEGAPYGFKEKISEEAELPNIGKKEARALAETAARQDWQIDLSPYEEIEVAKKVQPNGRIDRTFVYERTDARLNEGTYRLKLRVSGNKLTKVKHYVKVPQDFLLRYKEMRSTNNSIAQAASMLALILYVVIGCILGLFILIRLKWVIWQAPIKWALLVAGLHMLTTFNQLPLTWMYYQTETPMQGFILQLIVQALYSFFITFTMIALIFITAESLTRRAFGDHVQLWRSWSSSVANSYTILGQTIGGYLLIGIDMAFLITFYYATTHYLGWWTPLSQLIDPNVLSYYMPWFSSIAISLNAGFIEECKFRAIPLAGTALLADRFGGNRKLWIGAAFILQAIVFGAAHANYASMPAYARLVELIIPSFIFAGVYLRFGLLPAVISHYAYDVFWFALPIFLMQTPQGWLNQIMVLLFTFLPLLIVFYRRYQAGSWSTLPTEAYNKAWRPAIEAEATAHAPTTVTTVPWHKHMRLGIIGLMLGAVGLWFATTRFISDSSALLIDRPTAIAHAQNALAERQQMIDAAYQALAQVHPKYTKNNKADLQHKYVWQTYGKDAYHALLGSHLQPAYWLVRFVRFEGDLLERAQEYQVHVGAKTYEDMQTYDALAWKHSIPEKVPGAQLAKKEARAIAHAALAQAGIPLDTLYEVSAKPKKYSERTDWTFTFANEQTDQALERGQARTVITIAGDQVTGASQKVHIPESYERNERRHENSTQSLQVLCYLLLQALFISAMIVALLRWAGKHISARLFAFCFAGYAILFCVKLLNSWPHLFAQYNTIEPLAEQIFRTYSLLIFQYLLRCGIFAFVTSLILSMVPQKSYRTGSSLLLCGGAAGIVQQAGVASVQWLFPSSAPLWADYLFMSGWSVALSFIIHYLMHFFVYTMAFSLGAIALNYVTAYGTKKHVMALCICISAGLAMLGIQHIEFVWHWIASGSILGILLYALWWYCMRYSVASVAIMQATALSLVIIQQIAFDRIAHVMPIGLLTIISILSVAYGWFYYQKRTINAHMQPATHR